MSHIKYITLALIILFTIPLYSELDLEIFDDSAFIDVEEHFYSLVERINVQTASRNELSQIPHLTNRDIQSIINYRRRNIIINAHYLLDAGLSRETIDSIMPYIEYGRSTSLEYNFQNFIRYQERTDNFRNINRLQASNNIYNFRFHHEYNTNVDNSPIPFGASLNIRTSPNSNLILGQYRIHHGYGLLLHRGSFVSQSPGFNTDFSQNRIVLASGARPYFSRSLLGIAYEHSLSDRFTLFLYSSYKDIGARIQDDKILVLLPDDTNPNRSVIQSFSGSMFSFQTGDLVLSATASYSHTSKEFISENARPISSAIAFSYRRGNYMLFSESAYSNSAFAHLAGIKNSFQRFSQIISYRHIESGYNAEFANFVSNSANQTNEKGLFYKVEFRNREFLVQTFADTFENIEPHERHLDRNRGVSYGIRAEKYSLFNFPDMTVGAAFREKHDKEWRNLTGIARYENRKREYARLSWQQANTRFLTTRLVCDFQQRVYPEHNIKNNGYALSQSVRMQFRNYRVSFTAGVFDTEIPLYLYLYSGRLNNPLLILSREGQYALIHVNYRLNDRLQLEVMNSFLKRDSVEQTASMMFAWNL